MGQLATFSLLVGGATTSYLVLKYLSSKKQLPLPPGPNADPIIGHLRVIPPVGQDMFFYEMGKRYGDVNHLSVLGRSLIILNSVRAASDLLDKRGTNYSGRPYFPLYHLLGVGKTLAFLDYGEDWRAQRKIAQQYFAKEKIKDFRHITSREALNLARDLLTDSDDLGKKLLRFSTAIIIEIAYGHQIVSTSDPYLQISGDCSRATSESGPPGGTPVDLFPFLRHFPSWFPGTFYANYAREASVNFRKLHEYPYEQVTKEMANGTARPSFLASLLDELRLEGTDNDPSKIQQIQSISAIMYVAGAETTASTLYFFVLAMVLHPECMLKAQEEMKRVIGTDRLPEFGDRDSLPYLECILQETLRWNQSVPSGVPHLTKGDDEYNGMFIPKGSSVIANTRSMVLDDSVYKDPFKFEPERFLPTPLGRGEPHTTAPFGFGRRICPGRFLANDNMWIAISTILATISILRGTDKNGKEIIPEVEIIATGIANRPSPFPCRFEPRTDTGAYATLISE